MEEKRAFNRMTKKKKRKHEKKKNILESFRPAIIREKWSIPLKKGFSFFLQLFYGDRYCSCRESGEMPNQPLPISGVDKTKL